MSEQKPIGNIRQAEFTYQGTDEDFEKFLAAAIRDYMKQGGHEPARDGNKSTKKSNA